MIEVVMCVLTIITYIRILTINIPTIFNSEIFRIQTSFRLSFILSRLSKFLLKKKFVKIFVIAFKFFSQYNLIFN